MGIPWDFGHVCYSSSHGISMGFYSASVGLPWNSRAASVRLHSSYGTSMGLLWDFCWTAVRLCSSHGGSVVFPWDSRGCSVRLLWDFRGTYFRGTYLRGTSEFPWCFLGVLNVLPRDFHGTLKFPRYFHPGNFMGFSWESIKLCRSHGTFMGLPSDFVIPMVSPCCSNVTSIGLALYFVVPVGRPWYFPGTLMGLPLDFRIPMVLPWDSVRHRSFHGTATGLPWDFGQTS